MKLKYLLILLLIAGLLVACGGDEAYFVLWFEGRLCNSLLSGTPGGCNGSHGQSSAPMKAACSTVRQRYTGRPQPMTFAVMLIAGG